MCQFVSWIEKRNKVYFLTGKQLETEKGRRLFKTISRDDISGHDTIRAYYGIDSQDGLDKECTDFSTPDNFPEQIVKAIKNGDMRGNGYSLELLSPEGKKNLEYYPSVRKAEDAYLKAWDAYIEAWGAYIKARGAYIKARGVYFWDVFANPEYRKKRWR